MVGAAHRDLAGEQGDHPRGPRQRRRERRAVHVADRDRERVGGVVGPGLCGEPEQRLHHPRDLLLAGAAVAADGALDLLGRVARARNAALPGGEHRHAARLADRERGAHVLAEVELLERHRVGLVLAQQRVHRPWMSASRRSVGVCADVLDDAPVERHETPGRAGDDAVAGRREPGIDAEHDHGP